MNSDFKQLLYDSYKDKNFLLLFIRECGYSASECTMNIHLFKLLVTFIFQWLHVSRHF